MESVQQDVIPRSGHLDHHTWRMCMGMVRQLLNLQVCKDCHTSTKFILKIVGRQSW
jgi:hypothetical protein